MGKLFLIYFWLSSIFKQEFFCTNHPISTFFLLLIKNTSSEEKLYLQFSAKCLEVFNPFLKVLEGKAKIFRINTFKTQNFVTMFFIVSLIQ